jgi:hypothetical protein
MSKSTLAGGYDTRPDIGLRMAYPRVIFFYTLGLCTCLALLGFATFKPGSVSAFAGDSLFVLNFAKTYMNGDGFRINPNMGFPGVQDNAFFPSFDFSYRLVLRLIAPFVSNVFVAYYLLQLLGAATMFLAAAFALRRLGFRHWLAIVGAIVFVVSPYYSWRILGGHDFLALYFSVPLGAALALGIGSWRPEMTVRAFAASATALVMLGIIATSGLYYAFFSMLFIAFTGLIGAAATRRVAPLVAVLISVAIVFPVLVVTGFGSALGDVISGAMPTIKRSASTQLILGLNLAEATYVFKDIKPLRWAFVDFDSVRNQLSGVVSYEWPGLFLTAIIFASPVLLAISGVVEANRSTWIKLIYISSACLVFGIIFSVNGGLAYYFNLFIAPQIRATARIMPFLAFFALVVVLAGIEMLLVAGSALYTALAVAAIAALILSMVPSVNGFARNQDANASQVVEKTRQMLAAKDRAQISAVLQLPYAQWPEPPAFIRTFSPYSHEEAFVLDRKGSTTKWSYGAAPYQPSWTAVGNVVVQHAKSGLAPAAAGLGFDAILIEKRAYDDAEMQILRANIEADRTCKLFEDDLRVLYHIGSTC